MSKDKASNNTAMAVIAVIVIVLLGGFIYWYKTSAPEPAPVPTPPVAVPTAVIPKPAPAPEPAPAPVIEPAVEPPAPVVSDIEPPAPKVELPPLDSSDEFVAEQLKPKVDATLLGLIVPDEVVRKTARAIIGISDNRLVNQYRPVLSPLPTMKVEETSSGPDAEYRLTDDNFKRYQRHLTLMESIEPATLADMYQELAPIFNEAYAEQGLDGDFKEVLLNAINNMLATPEVNKPITLKRPAVMYTFADPKLEALPDPQKLMLRMGPENQKRVKAYLEAFKAELAQQP
ncbi:DUF3014 domain-containing protein [Gilvimarinus polysaccharolyticus]|uniref:DUF3014 domain-containing protein n=1 Tax=Gilvimarinus polysaccharolyticus TaxID=863921 RepID=UPI0006733E70|nr:DUF3014 domain-containing protein [Gilvimarinus polysaccharolyticus]